MAALITTRPVPWLLLAAGLFLGTAIGYARARANRFKSFLGSPINWVAFVSLLIVAMALASDMFIGAWAASLSAYFVSKFLALLAARRITAMLRIT